jgi:hypothetical protein
MSLENDSNRALITPFLVNFLALKGHINELSFYLSKICIQKISKFLDLLRQISGSIRFKHQLIILKCKDIAIARQEKCLEKSCMNFYRALYMNKYMSMIARIHLKFIFK